MRSLLALHFLGLGVAFGGVIGHYVLLLVTNASPPGDAATLGRPSVLFNRYLQTGFGILLVSGAILLWYRWNGPPVDWFWFSLKMVAVAGLAILVGVMAVMLRKARGQRDMLAAGRFPLMNRLATTLLIFIVVFASFAFN